MEWTNNHDIVLAWQVLLLEPESALSSRSNLSYSSYGNSKVFEKLQ